MGAPRRERKFPRREYDRTIGILLHGRFYYAHGLTVGEGGLGAYGDLPAKINDHVVVTIFIPKCGFIAMTAQLKHIEKLKNKETSLGFEFVNINFDSKRVIREFVSQRSEDEASQEMLKVV